MSKQQSDTVIFWRREAAKASLTISRESKRTGRNVSDVIDRKILALRANDRKSKSLNMRACVQVSANLLMTSAYKWKFKLGDGLGSAVSLSEIISACLGGLEHAVDTWDPDNGDKYSFRNWAYKCMAQAMGREISTATFGFMRPPRKRPGQPAQQQYDIEEYMEQEHGHIMGSVSSPENDLAAQDTYRQVVEVLLGLPKKELQALLLCTLHGDTVRSACVKMGVSSSYVAKLKKQASEKLVSRLQDAGLIDDNLKATAERYDLDELYA